MPRFIFKNLPQGISETRRIAIENHLSKLKVYQETDIVHLSYIGGITNHGFVIGINGAVAVLVDENHVASL